MTKAWAATSTISDDFHIEWRFSFCTTIQKTGSVLGAVKCKGTTSEVSTWMPDGYSFFWATLYISKMFYSISWSVLPGSKSEVECHT